MIETPSRRPIILDTNVLSELARPRPDADVVAMLQRISDRTFITVITLGELRLGVELLDDGRRKRELLHHVQVVQEAYADRTIPLSPAVVENYAVSVAQLTQSGVTISVNDAYIAATAVTHDATLYTRNLKDFERYPGIDIASPWGIEH